MHLAQQGIFGPHDMNDPKHLAWCFGKTLSVQNAINFPAKTWSAEVTLERNNQIKKYVASSYLLKQGFPTQKVPSEHLSG